MTDERMPRHDRPMPADAAALDAALADLGRAIAWPTAGATGRDLAVRVRERLEHEAAEGAGRRTPPRPWRRLAHLRSGSIVGRPMRRGLVLALVALLALAVAAGAIGLGLPGLRIILGGPAASFPPASVGPSQAPPGAGLGLGTAMTLAEAGAEVPFAILVPGDPSLGPPDAVYAGPGRVALAWAPRPDLPDAEGDGVGLLLTEYDGAIGSGYVRKVIADGTRITPALVGDATGYWIDGGPHFFLFVDSTGRSIEDSHRVVGDTLIWTADGVTYRIESSLGREAMIEFAIHLQ